MLATLRRGCMPEYDARADGARPAADQRLCGRTGNAQE
jgi:hypothetical protein